MNLSHRFERCKNLLEPWLDFLEIEALKHYPNHLSGELKKWYHSLENLSDEQLWKFQTELDVSLIESDSLKKLILAIKEVTSFKEAEFPSANLPDNLLRKIKPKKKHEIDSILQLVLNIGNIDSILDIGGGLGYLSSALVHGYDRKAFCVDSNEKLQSAGITRLKKWDQDSLDKVKFVHAFVNDHFHLSEFDKEMNRLVIGLHSCGELGTSLVKMVPAREYESLILASCCYHKLNGAYNISNRSKQERVSFSTNALHLASRCYRDESFKEFQDKIMLRKYRYALHLLNYSFGRTEFEAIGNTDLGDYQSSFYHYVKKYSSHISLSQEEINSFYTSPKTKASLKEIILSDIIRAMFGRLIEVYLILDRGLYLIDHGYNVQLYEAFDRKFSPRNLVILCYKDTSSSHNEKEKDRGK